MALYSSSEITSILNKAYTTMYKLNAIAEEDRFMYDDQFKDGELFTIWMLTECIENERPNRSTDKEFNSLVAFLLNKIEGHGFDAEIPFFETVTFTATGSVSGTIIITHHPESYVKIEGQQVIFTVIATGSGTLSYQWRKGGVNIPGANSSTLVFASATEANEGDYDVVITDANGNKASNIGTLTVNQVSSSITYYYGYNSTGLISTEAEIFALQFSGLSPIGSAITEADFRSLSVPKRLIIAYPSSEPLKHYYYGDTNNNGPIGGVNDLFGPAQTVGGFTVHISNYDTFNTSTTIQLKTTL